MNVSCPHCENTINGAEIFCGFCGKKITGVDSVKEKISIQRIVAFYISFLVYALIAYFLYSESDSLITEIVIETIFVLLTLVFTFLDVKNIFPLYNFKLINWKSLLFSVSFPVVSAVIVYFGVEAINNLLFEEDYSNLYYEYLSYENPFMWAFIFIAILPPIFEELAFRGFLFNQLQNVATPRVTILTTAFIFALIHFSFISFIWIFPFGIVLGYLRHKFNTLWLGVIVHFIHNFLVLLFDYNETLF